MTISPTRDAGEGAEGRKRPYLSFGGAGGTKVPFMKCNAIFFWALIMIQMRKNKLYKQSKYVWKRELFV